MRLANIRACNVAGTEIAKEVAAEQVRSVVFSNGLARTGAYSCFEPAARRRDLTRPKRKNYTGSDFRHMRAGRRVARSRTLPGSMASIALWFAG